MYVCVKCICIKAHVQVSVYMHVYNYCLYIVLTLIHFLRQLDLRNACNNICIFGLYMYR